VPESKKRKKKRTKTAGPPPSKQELTSKKKKLTRQQILIYVFSALIIASLAISFIVSGLGGGRSQRQDPTAGGQDIILATPAPDGGGMDTGHEGESGSETTSQEESSGE